MGVPGESYTVLHMKFHSEYSNCLSNRMELDLTMFFLLLPLSERNKQPNPGMASSFLTGHLCGLASLSLASEIRITVLVREAECLR